MSALRLCLTAVLAYKLACYHFQSIVALFFLGCVTDFLDGYLARRFRWESAVGKVLDPLADKMFIGILFIVLGLGLNLFHHWLVILVIGRDLLIMGAVFILWRLGRLKKIEPSFISKFNTGMQMLLLLWGFIFLEFHISFLDPIFLSILVAITTLMSLWDYGRKAFVLYAA